MTQRQRTGWFLVVALLVVFGMLRRGTRRVTALDHPSLDERDLAARDRAFRLAYPLLMVVVLVTFVVMVLDATEITRLLERGPAFESHETMSWVGTADIRSALLWVALWWVYLPTGILAWREPDAIGLGRGASPGVPEQTRDALLGLALGAGLVLGLFASTAPWGLLALTSALALLGGLARREAGQPPVASSTLRATGIVLIGGAAALVVLTVRSPTTVAVATGALAAGLALVVIASRGG